MISEKLRKGNKVQMKLRIKFAKTGVMRFVGHLDVMRYFQKAIRRAGIDIAYSGGFSPHQIMSFAAPLGLGLQSRGEYMDIEVNSYTSSEDMKQRLNQTMVPGMEVLSVTMLGDQAKNAMASVAAAEYSVRFRKGCEPDFDWVSRLKLFYDKPSVMVTKQTKKSRLEVDLKPAIYSLSVSESASDGRDRAEIRMFVDASSAGNVKPRMILEAFLAENGRTLDEAALEITREDTYTNTGTAEQPVFVPLDAVGRAF